MDTRDRKPGRRREEVDMGGDVIRRLAALEEEIEEHRRWLREDPLLQRQSRRAA